METTSNHQKLKSLDYTGIFFSFLCMLHCLFLPVIASLTPAFTHQLESEWIHVTLLAILVPVALVSFVSSQKAHRRVEPLVLGCSGILFLFGAVCIEHMGFHGWESWFTLLGSLLLILAHILNLKYELSAGN